jgi:DNA polymerase I
VTTMTETKPLLATNENMPLILSGLQAAEDIALDTEATGLNVRNKVDYLTGICFDVPLLSGYIPFRHKEHNVDKRWLEPLVNIIKSKPLIWHNRKYDYFSLATLGVDPLEFEGPQYDTLIIAQLVNEELPSKELDFLCRWYKIGDKVADDDQFYEFGTRFGFENIPVSLAVRRAIDATLTRRLRDVLWPKLVQQELDAVYWDTEAPFTTLLYRLEKRAVGTDSEFAERKATVGNGRMATLRRELGINPASPIDLKRVLLDELNLPVLAHTKSCENCEKGRSPVGEHEGPPSFNKVVMEEYDTILGLMDNHMARQIAEYRGWQKAVSSLYLPVLEKVGPDGFLRTNFKQHGTVTGRLSSEDPNLQQVPRSSPKVWNGNAKSCFTSGRDRDYALIGWDYSQVELRLAAAYGQEHVLLAEFEKDESDPFKVLTPLIFGEYSEELRHKTKNGFVYPSLYGAGLAKVALSIGLTVPETQPLYNNYKASIPGITALVAQVQTLAEQRGYVRYWDGRRRHFKNKRDAFKAWNSVLQGGAAQLMKKAMLRCQEFEDENCFMVLTVHDEITFVIRRDLIPHYEPLIVKAMTDWPEFGVRLKVESKEWK